MFSSGNIYFIQSGPQPSPDQQPRANMASQTDPLAEPAKSTPGILEVLAVIYSCQTAIATCQTALTNKIEAVQLDMGLITRICIRSVSA